jgi:transposase InsO family protein
VKQLCDVLEVGRSAYYAWQQALPSSFEVENQRLKPMVHEIFLQHRRRYGARRIVAELQSFGETCSRTRVRKIMEELDLLAIQPRSFKPRTTNSRHTLGYSPNLLLDGVAVTRINQVWVGDITYIPLKTEFAYLAMKMDLFSRKIVGWAFEQSMDEGLVIDALKQAIKSRQPSPDLIHHTDRGGQYASINYRQLLARAQMKQSMSRAGDCYDNAFMESCFGTVKTELEMTAYESFEKAMQEIREYINYYNSIRRHSSIDYQSPTRFESSLEF